MSTCTIRVGLIGYGAIGASLATLVEQEPCLELGAVLIRNNPHPPQAAVETFEDLLAASDIVVEAAGPGALRAYAPRALEVGKPLLVTSVGALLTRGCEHLYTAAREGRLMATTGAIGGLDLVRAAALADPDLELELLTTKPPRTLVQPWMDEQQADDLVRMSVDSGPRQVFSGNATEAAELFPANLNVAAALALCAGSPSQVKVVLVADAREASPVHQVSVSSEVGTASMTFRNVASASNPSSSSVVAWSLLRGLRDLAGAGPALR
jgi:aspartate dehydrogenase